MKIYPECYNCFISQAIRSSRIYTSDNKKILEVVQRVIRVLTDINHSLPPPLISENVYKTITKTLGIDDPYKEIKKKYNDLVLEREKPFKTRIKESKDPIAYAMKLSLAGNIIDFGSQIKKFNIEETINDTLKNGFDKDDMQSFKKELDKAKTLVLIADNAGEVVFDKILLETIKTLYPNLKIYCFVRGGPIINDVTPDDAKYIGMDKAAEIVKTQKAIPGFWPEFCKNNCKEIWNSADIIISKGQGNFETLSEIKDKRIYFLFIVKCMVVANFLNLKKYSKIFMKNVL